MTTLPCILIPLIVGLISAILGYLLGKLNSKNNNSEHNYQSEYDNCMKDSKGYKDRIAQLELELMNANQSLKNNVSSDLNFRSATVEPDLPFDSELAFGVFGKKIKQDDLKIVEGIGPKIEELFHSFGIKTWKNLSETTLEKMESVLDSGGERFKIHNPSTWARQAKMAYEGKWEDLKRWQDELDGGKE